MFSETKLDVGANVAFSILLNPAAFIVAIIRSLY
jgi:hypothetical protein